MGICYSRNRKWIHMYKQSHTHTENYIHAALQTWGKINYILTPFKLISQRWQILDEEEKWRKRTDNFSGWSRDRESRPIHAPAHLALPYLLGIDVWSLKPSPCSTDPYSEFSAVFSYNSWFTNDFVYASHSQPPYSGYKRMAIIKS